MIIFRYFTKEVYGTLLATTGVLLLLLISNQFVHYLNQAAAGTLPIRTVMQLMSLQIPLLLGLLLPLGLFIGILLAYGRFYADHEMVVLSACGFSKAQLIKITLIFSLLVSIVTAVLMMWLEPKMVWYKRHILFQAAQSSPIDRIFPNQFTSIENGRLVFYATNLTRNHQHLQEVFIAQASKPLAASPSRWSIIVAGDGEQQIDPKTGDRFLVLGQGYRYSGIPGQVDFEIVHYQQYGLRVQQNLAQMRSGIAEMSTSQLWHNRHLNSEMAAELQWRIALPISVLILGLLAVPLSQANPRHGRYAKLVPALLLYILYADLLFMAQAWLQKGQIPAFIGMWWVHAVMLLIAIGFTMRFLGRSFLGFSRG